MARVCDGWRESSHPLWPDLSYMSRLMFPGQISAGATKASISLIRLGVSHCSMTQWVKQKGKERRKRWLLRWKIRRKMLKVSGGEGAGGRDEKEWHAGRRKEERCSRNERALLLLIIGGVMCQHSLRGFPPKGMIPWGLGHWNHITASPHAPAHFLCLLMVKEEGSRAPFCSFLSIFMETHSCRVGCGTPLKGFLSKEYSIWDLICGHWQKELYRFLLYLFKMLLSVSMCAHYVPRGYFTERKDSLSLTSKKYTLNMSALSGCPPTQLAWVKTQQRPAMLIMLKCSILEVKYQNSKCKLHTRGYQWSRFLHCLSKQSNNACHCCQCCAKLLLVAFLYCICTHLDSAH